MRSDQPSYQDQNIYESIFSNTPERKARPSSGSLSQLNLDQPDTQRPLLAIGSEQLLDRSHQAPVSPAGRRYLNPTQAGTFSTETTAAYKTPSEKVDNSDRNKYSSKTSARDTSNLYSEIAACRRWPSQANEALCLNLSNAPSLRDEMDQLMESKRRRTLIMLRNKEAPRASFEQTSQMEDEPLLVNSHQTDGLAEDGAKAESATCLSEYENMTPSRHIDSAPTGVDTCDLISPSDSAHNFNTLSLVSDVLADIGTEDHSIVNQLGDRSEASPL